MIDEKPFNLKEFKKEVFDDLQRTRKSQDRIISINQKELKEYTNEFGFIKRNILKIVNKINLYSTNRYLELQKLSEINKKTNEILNDVRVKKLLCNEFKKRNLDNLFAQKLDSELITVFAKLFIDKPISSELIIEKKVSIFSLLIKKTKEKGIAEFCK